MRFYSHSLCGLLRPIPLFVAATVAATGALADDVPASVTAGFARALGTPVALPAGVSPSDVPLDGSWKDSCSDARLVNPPDQVRGVYLFATCRKIDGTNSSTNINVAACGQPPRFGNQDGKLVCESGLRADIVPGQTRGVWSISCVYDTVVGTTLSAICSNNSNGLTKTSLDFGTCAQPARITVVDGQLTCGNGPRNPPVHGSWSASCLNETLSGTILSALCFAINGQTRETSLDLGTCNAPATAGNQDGTLICESGVKLPPVVQLETPPVVMPQPPPVTVPQPSPGIVATPAPVIVPTPAPAPAVPSTNFGDIWTVVTERGDSFDIDMKQTGKAIAGSVTLGDKVLQLNGSVIGTADEKVSLVWQVGDLAGTGELILGAGKQDLSGKLLMGDGTPLQGGTWKGARKDSGPALPFGEVKEVAALPQGATAATPPAAGYERAVSTTELAIRDKPTSKGSKILGSLKTGEVVSVRCPPDNAYWCQLQDGRGWVSRQYINIGPTATATPPPAATKKSSTAKKQDPKKDNINETDNSNEGFIQGLGRVLCPGLGVCVGR